MPRSCAACADTGVRIGLNFQKRSTHRRRTESLWELGVFEGTVYRWSRRWNQPIVFDMPHATGFTKARTAWLDGLLRPLIAAHGYKTAVDVGCGVGYFSAYLQDLGLRVVATDGRAENVAEAKRRLPGVTCVVHDVENRSLRQLGVFDVVLCVGLSVPPREPVRRGPQPARPDRPAADRRIGRRAGHAGRAPCSSTSRAAAIRRCRTACWSSRSRP